MWYALQADIQEAKELPDTAFCIKCNTTKSKGDYFEVDLVSSNYVCKRCKLIQRKQNHLLINIQKKSGE